MENDPTRRERPFRITEIRAAYRHVTARHCVIGPLLKRKQLHDIPRAYDQVRDRWHATLYGLYAADWRPLAGKERRKALSYMRNCPPFGVRTETTSKCCRRSIICPFCYGRQYVLRPFCNFERVLFGSDTYHKDPLTGKQLKPIRPDLRVVAFRTVTRGTYHVPGDLYERMEDHVACTRRFMDKSRRYERDLFAAEYGSVQFRVFPMPAENRLSVVRCGVLLVRDGIPSPIAAGYVEEGGSFVEYEPSKLALHDACRFAFAYPRGIMDAPSPYTARMLEGLHYARVSTWYGPRGDREQKEED